VTGLILLAFAMFAWFCYATTGVVVALGGEKHLPRFVEPLLRPADHHSTTWVGHVGAIVVGSLWLILAIVPQVALVREVLIGRTSATETGAIVLGLIGCIAWLGFLGRASLKGDDSSTA